MMQELQPEDPQLIGPYRLRKRLGAGGMGRVYLALSPGGKPVAVKVIRADLAQDAEFRARFRREIAVARKVSGLFTASVIDADLEGPVPWLATEYVSGPSLADAVSQHGPLSPGSVLALASGLAEGLSAIHAAGVVHRDLKPANVLLAQDGPRVIDFGISRAAEASALTHTGLVVGSPGFMSPEQAEGREVGPPSDIFSLGAVLAFAATGQGPFGTGSTPALVYRVVHSLPQLDELPAEVRPVVERCLAKDPARRPTARELLTVAAFPEAGWLPEPVTRTVSVERFPMTVTSAGRPLVPPDLPPRVPAIAALPAVGGPAAGGPGGAARRGRWRTLTAAAVLAGLAGAGATAGLTMTAASVGQSAQRAAVQTLAPSSPASSPASGPNGVSSSPAATSYGASSSPAAAARTTPTTPAYVPGPTAPPATVAPTTVAPTTVAPASPAPSTPAPHTTPPAPAPSTSSAGGYGY